MSRRITGMGADEAVASEWSRFRWGVCREHWRSLSVYNAPRFPILTQAIRPASISLRVRPFALIPRADPRRIRTELPNTYRRAYHASDSAELGKPV